MLHLVVDSVHRQIPALASHEKMILSCSLKTPPSLKVSVSGHTVVEAVASNLNSLCWLMTGVSEVVAGCCGTHYSQSQDQGEKGGNTVASPTAGVLGVEVCLTGHEVEMQAFERPYL